jgi:hypothetical protein
MEDLTIEFDFLEMDSWNNENFSVYLNGLEVSLGTFSSWANEDGRSGSVNGISWSIDSEAPANEGGGSNYNYDDQVHHVTMTIDNNPGILDSDELTLKFDADLDMGIDNESYGIDNLVISGDLSDSPSLVDNDDFVDADQTDGWSLNSRETIGSLGSVLGRFSGSENVQKSYILHETTEYAQLKFDFIEMDSWDNEEFSVIVNGKEVSLGTFYVYADEGDRTGNTDGITWEFTSDSATNYGGSHWVDQKHYVTMNVPKAYLDFNRVTFEFDAKLNSGVSDESYALDNVSVAGIQSKSITVANETYDFGAFGWSINQTDADDDLAGTAVLGRFTGSQDVEKTFDLPGDTEGIRVEFDFLENDSWNNENFSVYLNGLQVDLGNFNFRNDEGNRSGSQNGVSWTTTSQGAPTDNAFGGYDDQVHRVVLTSTVAALTGDELTVKFDATLNSNVNNESYGIDNFLVKAAVGIVDLLPVDFDTTFEHQTISTQIDSSLWDSVNAFGTFLGRFGRDDDVTYGMAFNDYDLASGGKIEFDFLEIDSWNNEEFIVTVNGREVNLGKFNFQTDEGDKSGWSNGIRWEFNTTEYGDIGFWSYADAKHTVTLDFAANTMSGHYLQLEFNAELNSDVYNESFGIDNIKLIGDGSETIIDNTNASNSALKFAQGHIDVGSSLEAGDLLLQGQAMVSIDKTTALYLSQSGNLQLLHDSDGDGDYETDHAVFGNATFDRVGIKESNGASGVYPRGRWIGDHDDRDRWKRSLS